MTRGALPLQRAQAAAFQAAAYNQMAAVARAESEVRVPVYAPVAGGGVARAVAIDVHFQISAEGHGVEVAYLQASVVRAVARTPCIVDTVLLLPGRLPRGVDAEGISGAGGKCERSATGAGLHSGEHHHGVV